MADIDKALPNTETVVQVPAQEELVEAKEDIAEKKDKQGNIEVTMDEGKSTAEIAKDPLNWIGLAAMEPLSKVSGVAEKGGMNAVLRLGLNPATIRGITRFAGLPGLAISTAMTAYDQYKKYQNEEGFVYNLFNKEGT